MKPLKLHVRDRSSARMLLALFQDASDQCVKEIHDPLNDVATRSVYSLALSRFDQWVTHLKKKLDNE